MPRFASTTEPLDANEEWASTPFSPQASDHLVGIVKSDVAGTLHCEQSINGTDWDLDETVAVAAGVGSKFSFTAIAPHIRLRYTNGPAAQTYFRIAARFSSTGARP